MTKETKANTRNVHPIIPPETVRLLDMLSWRRPAGTRTEKRFIREYIVPLGVKQDRFGNLIKRIGTAPILWSCHTDTVHTMGGRQRLHFANQMISLAKGSGSNCLGADDTVGVFIMCEMIKAGVEGLYIFHRAEEIGGKGSKYIAKQTPHVLGGIKAAIAFDRRGINEVITHQFGRCCSDAFARSMADILGMGYEPSQNGVFTDTANYTDIVGECTNLGVGYYGQHGSTESVDVVHVRLLLAKMVAFNKHHEDLVFERKPGTSSWEDDWYSGKYGYGSQGDFGGYGGYNPKGRYHGGGSKGHYNGAAYGSYGGYDHDTGGSTTSTERRFLRLVEENPDAIVDILEDCGFTFLTLVEEIAARYGIEKKDLENY